MWWGGVLLTSRKGRGRKYGPVLVGGGGVVGGACLCAGRSPLKGRAGAFNIWMGKRPCGAHRSLLRSGCE